jgi:hypothetical protein
MVLGISQAVWYMVSQEIVFLAEVVGKIKTTGQACILGLIPTDARVIEFFRLRKKLKRIVKRFKGEKLVANMTEGGQTPYLSVQMLSEMGGLWRIILFLLCFL